MRHVHHLAVLSVAAAVTLTSNSLRAVNTYTSNSATSVSDPAPDSATSTTGDALQLSAASTTNRAFTDGANNIVKPVTDDVFARAALSSGTLRTRAILGLGSDLATGGSGVPAGVRNGAASGTATFADSFSTKSTSTGAPFLWSAGDQAGFNFAITGQYSVPANVTPPQRLQHPSNLVLGTLRFQALAPGGLDLLNQLQNFDFDHRPFSDYDALNTQYEAHRLPGGFGFWYLGDPVASFDAGTDTVLAVDPTTPTNVNFSFNPNGDFEWFLMLDNTVQLDASLQNTTVTLDFSHTIQTTYSPPAGAVTLSASGLFPDTLPLPEPSLLIPLAASLPVLTRRRRH